MPFSYTQIIWKANIFAYRRRNQSFFCCRPNGVAIILLHLKSYFFRQRNDEANRWVYWPQL